MPRVERTFDSDGGTFYLIADDQRAGYISFKTASENTVEVDHTKICSEYEGRGLAKLLLDDIVQYARENNLKVVPICSYAVHMFNKNHEYDDVKKDVV